MHGYTSIGLSWPDSTIDEEGYHLDRSTDGQNWQRITDLHSNTAGYIDEGLQRHTDYWYRLTAFNGQGESLVQEVNEVHAETGMDQPTSNFSNGTMIIDYDYDPLNRLTNAIYNHANFFKYDYDFVGNRKTETTPYGTTVYAYDPANRMESVNGGMYTWDDNGNLRNDGTHKYDYDQANRLTKVSDQADTILATYTYNGLGDRVTETSNGITTNFALDLNAGLTQVLYDGTSNYLYGNNRIAQYSAGGDTYFLGDALGSVRQLIDAAGAVTLTKTYEPYGEVMGSIGSGSTKYGFTGEWTLSTNLIYLRARFYSPVEGSFISKDPWKGDPLMPSSFNSHLYVADNPINFIDPTGLRRIMDWLAYQRYLKQMGEDIDIIHGDISLGGTQKLLSPTAMGLIALNFEDNPNNVQKYNQYTFMYSCNMWIKGDQKYGGKNYNRYDWLFSGWVDYWMWRSSREGKAWFVNDPNLIKAVSWKETNIGMHPDAIGQGLGLLSNLELDNLRGVFSYSRDLNEYGMTWGLLDIRKRTDPVQNIAGLVRLLNAKYHQYLRFREKNGESTDPKSVWIAALKAYGPHPGADDYDPLYGEHLWEFYQTGTFRKYTYVFGEKPKGFTREDTGTWYEKMPNDFYND